MYIHYITLFHLIYITLHYIRKCIYTYIYRHIPVYVLFIWTKYGHILTKLLQMDGYPNMNISGGTNPAAAFATKMLFNGGSGGSCAKEAKWRTSTCTALSPISVKQGARRQFYSIGIHTLMMVYDWCCAATFSVTPAKDIIIMLRAITVQTCTPDKCAMLTLTRRIVLRFIIWLIPARCFLCILTGYVWKRGMSPNGNFNRDNE